ncbi:MAG: phosphoribosylanthranilate isomerase [Chloroflexi bacterium]|nr:phosphoribosylanthranilate isomerase [Chloroflexota bacterium]
MRHTRVKICGIRTLQEAFWAVNAGADLLGFNFYPSSPRYITPEDCQSLTNSLRNTAPSTILVGVFVNAAPEQISITLDRCSLDFAQLSGDEPPDVLEALGKRGLKALRLNDANAAQSLVNQYPLHDSPPAFLLDAFQPGAYGGTGQPANWHVAQGLATQFSVLLAGGLRPENVTEALSQVHPWGVDVASGVETSPGKKDPELIAAFIRNVQLFDKQDEYVYKSKS